jgi:Zn-dependent peptidase ImmA (M78 family)
MSKWSVAHRVAQLAAHRARGDAGLAPAHRADVIALIEDSGVMVFGQDAAKLFGAYLPATENRVGKVWLNAGLTVNGQRHTAAHEWGHHVLNHRASCDATIESLTGEDRHTARSLPESTAEAFAAWLLMPRSALVVALRALGATGVPTRLQCYEVSLLLGTSYRGTARHLSTARLIEPAESAALMRAVPGRIKAVLDEPGTPPPHPRADIWRLSHLHAWDDLVIAEGDRIIIDHDDAPAVETLLATGLASFVTETETATVLQTTADHDHARPSPVQITLSGSPIQVRIDRRIRGLATADFVPDLSTLNPEQIDELLAQRSTTTC